jgi:hypothetical protein
MKYLILVLLSFSAFADKYSEIFPFYFEYFSGTQLKYINGPTGGPGGHGFMYIHGLCKDFTSEIPKVIPCSKLPKNHPYKGVGISLDSDYKTYPWVAIPGRDLLVGGELDRTAQVNKKAIEDVVNKSIDLRIFKGLEVKPGIVDAALKPGTVDYERAVAEFSIGTNIAVNWARELDSIKFPIPEAGLEKVAKFLNDTNKNYAKVDDLFYNWSLMHDNCTHLVLNAMAELGINTPIKVNTNKFEQMFHLAVPQNAYWLYQEIGNFRDIKFDDVLKNDRLLANLRAYDWLPTGVGAINTKIPVYSNNKVFIADNLKIIALPRKNTLLCLNPFQIFHNFQYRKMSKRIEFRSLKENMLHWKTKYTEMLRHSGKRKFSGKNHLGRYQNYLLKQIQFIEKNLPKL